MANCEVTFFTVIFKIAKQIFIKLEVEKHESWKFSQSIGNCCCLLCKLYKTTYTVNQRCGFVIKLPGQPSFPLLSCFEENRLKLNLDKHHLIPSGNENAETELDNFSNSNSKRAKLHYLWWWIEITLSHWKVVQTKWTINQTVTSSVDLSQENILFKAFL